jgi:hypothetical protein
VYSVVKNSRKAHKIHTFAVRTKVKPRLRQIAG